MKRARLWEDTIVLALRDQQWLRRSNTESANLRSAASNTHHAAPDEPATVLPAGMIKFDGRAESKIGDVSLRDGERFYIFEVKSEESRIPDEWMKGGKFHPKLVFQKLRDLTVSICEKNASSDDKKSFERSARCHYFAYWRAIDNANGEIDGSIVIEPYISACARLKNVVAIDAQKHMPLFKNRLKFKTESPADRLRLSDIFESKMHSHSQPSVCCGLERDQFQAYIDFLCEVNGGGGGGGGEPIHAVVLSSYGSFFRVVSDTNHLASLLSGNLKPEPTDPRAKKRAYGQLHKFSNSRPDGI